MINSGGFVYPLEYSKEQFQHSSIVCRGITRRDWLAGLAMQGMMDGYMNNVVDDFDRIQLSVEAYKIADAMIEEGDK